MSAEPTEAQRLEVYGRAGLVGSTALVTDQIATAQMAQILGSPVDEEVRAVPAPGPVLAGGVRAAFWPRVTLGAEASWAATTLEAHDDAGTRPIQDVAALQATVSAGWRLRPDVELGAGAGLIWYRTEDEGLFADGADASPVVEFSAAWIPSWWSGRASLIGAVQSHRFSTPSLRAAGGQDGTVTRLSLGARVRLLEVGR